MKNYFANVYNKLMSRFTIKTKILIIVLVNTILILTIFGIVIKIQSDEIFNNINTQEKLRLKALNNSLDHYKKLIHDYSEIISHNENVEQELFFQKTKGTFEQYKIKKLIYPIFKTIKVDYLTIYDTNKTVMLRGHNLNHFNDKIINDNILNKTLKNENHHTLIMQNPSNNKFVLMSYNPVHFNNQIVGACSVGFNMDYHFLNKLEKLVGNKLLLSLNGKIISRSFLESPTTNNIPKDFNLKLDYLNVGTIPIIDIKDGVYKTINYDASYMHLATHKVLKSVGFYLLTDNNKLKNHIQTLQTVSIFIIILIIITTVILTYLFAHNIKIHVQKVVQGFKKLAHGDLSTNLEITSQDEMGQLSISFNSLAKQLKMHIESLDTLVEQRTIELKDSEERYRTLFDTSPDGIIVHDETGILYANKAAADLVGTDNPDKHIGQSVFGFVPPEYQEIVKERVTNIMKGLTDTEQRLDIKLNRLDGTVIDIETISTSFYNKGKRAILAIIRDITERKKAERALQESEARYRTLIETSPIGIAVNIKGKIVYINKSAAKIMEIDDIESIIGRDITDFVHPDYRELSRKRMMDIMENMTTVPSIEMKFIKLDGKIIDVESISTFITYKGKSAMVSIFSDITERKRIERLREDTELIVKHDLKSPLSGIIGFSELLLQDKK
ncbi:MAG: PAS domain S-box protein, partial [Spirochaetota bacterium]|nr:PAS domain S-box protein [Spirochaetota bacterium]